MSNCPQNVVAFVALSALTTLSSSIVFREHDTGQSLNVKENVVEINMLLIICLSLHCSDFWGLGAKAVTQRQGVAL